MVLENSPSDYETWSFSCDVEIHVNFTPILQSFTLLVPQAYCEANLDRLRLFHTTTKYDYKMTTSWVHGLLLPKLNNAQVFKFSVRCVVILVNCSCCVKPMMCIVQNAWLVSSPFPKHITTKTAVVSRHEVTRMTQAWLNLCHIKELNPPLC